GIYVDGRSPTSTILNTMNCTRAASACGWTLHSWPVLFRSTLSIAVPGPWLLHGKTSLFRSPSTSPGTSPVGLAGGFGRRCLQRPGVAGPAGVVHRQCFALRAAVRHLAGPERHSCGRPDLVGGGSGGAPYAPDTPAAVRSPPDGALRLVFRPDRGLARRIDLRPVRAVHVAVHRVLVQRAGGQRAGSG